jgi:uncharacterized protein YjbI with pentapeptide repeats
MSQEDKPTRPSYRVLSTRAIWIGALTMVVVAASSVWLLMELVTGGPNDSSRLEIIKTAGTILVGTGGAVALLLTARRQRFVELDGTERRITDLQSKAVDQLGSDQAAVRLAGLYALERLAQDNPSHRQSIVDIICGYLRMPYSPPSQPPARSRNTVGLRPRRPAWIRPQGNASIAGADNNSRQEKQVRLTAQRILSTHLRPKLESLIDRPKNSKYWPLIDVDLTGATLVTFDFRECRLRSGIFNDANFIGSATFGGAIFTERATFNRANFSEGVLFCYVNFNGATSFIEVTFNGLTEFDHALFHGGATFERASFATTAAFTQSTFTAAARFDSTIFNGEAVFNWANFSQNAWFVTASFDKGAIFTQAILTRATFTNVTFHGDCEFNKTIFASEAQFGGAIFKRNAQFTGASFDGCTWFTEVIPAHPQHAWMHCGGTGSFRGVTFDGEAIFSEAVFIENVLFAGVTFAKNASFHQAIFASGVSFDDATVNGAADFHGAYAWTDVAFRPEWPKGWTWGDQTNKPDRIKKSLTGGGWYSLVPAREG